ncbi:hypothetical protein KJZ63_03760 [Patescibacteria group bacterium]|nr:hypothetical protein [Patescibacteria group bacterium]
MSEINKTKTLDLLNKLVDQEIHLKSFNGKLFLFFGGDNEKCFANLYAFKNWEIREENNCLFNDQAIESRLFESVKMKIDGKKIRSFMISNQSFQIFLEEGFEIIIFSLGEKRDWEIRFRETNEFLTSEVGGFFLSQIP